MPRNLLSTSGMANHKDDVTRTHTGTEESHDPRGTFESTKHDRYPAILPNMRNGLYTCRRHVWSQSEWIDCTQGAHYRCR